MSRFPRLVEDWRGKQATALGCNACGRQMQAEIDVVCSAMDHTLCCPKCGEWALIVAYDVAERCKGCRRMGHHAEELDFCCSRRCLLQAEYHAFLRGRLKDAISLLPWRGY